jgi:SSS family solute:Na+ symporter
MDYVQLLFTFFNAPLFATFLLGMFTYWATPAGGFWGLLSGTTAAGLHYAAYRLGMIRYGSEMTANFYGAACAWLVCFLVTAGVSFWTPRRDRAEIAGLVYKRSVFEKSLPRNAWVCAALILLGLLVMNWAFY